MNAPGSPPASGGLLSSLQGLFATLMGMAHTRLDLLATELEEEKLRLLQVLAWGAAAVLVGCVGLVFLAAFVTLLFWDSHRLLVLGLMTAFFSMACAVAVQRVFHHLRSAPGLLQASLAELEQDRLALSASGDPVRQEGV